MSEHDVHVRVNGVERFVRVPARVRLVDLLRDEFGFASLHAGCDQGTCGSCTVLLDGEPVRSCLIAAPQIDGRAVTTLEGVRQTRLGVALHEAFASHEALQCGFCTPGLLVGAHALLGSGHPVDREAIEALVEGHLCRCTGYAPIVAALEDVAGLQRQALPAPSALRGPGRRPELDALLAGDVQFVSEVRRPAMLHAAVLRSPHAAARILRIDTSTARTMAGVAAILSGDDLADVPPLPQVMPHPLLHSRTPRALARDRVRYAGEPVCVVVADTIAHAEDAGDRISIEWSVTDAAIDVERAAGDGAARVHDDLESNVATRFRHTVGEVEEGFRGAECTVSVRLRLARVAAQALEPRTITAEYADGLLTVWLSTQSPHSARKMLAQQTALPVERIRVIAPRAGGGFGFKNRFYPEYTAVAIAAIRSGRPVRWIENREESFTASYHAGEQVHEASMAIGLDGRIRAVRDEFLYDQGAYTPLGLIVPWLTSISIPGPYRVPAYDVTGVAVFTNKTPASFYRGAGKPQATFVMERLLDRAADVLNMDRVEIRRRNLLRPEDFPYATGLPDTDGEPVVYDSGNIQQCLDEAVRRLNYADFAVEQRTALDHGRHIGIGLTAYMEKSGLGPFEGARVAVDACGRVSVGTGISTQGQGHESMFANLCADRLGIRPEDVRMTLGDTDAIPQGIGTYCARGAVMGGNAVAKAADLVRARVIAAAAEMTGVPHSVLRLERDGIVDHDGRRRVSLRDVAAHVASNLTAFPPDGELDQGLQATAYFRCDQPVFASGVYGVVVEVDAACGPVRVLRHCIVHDCGVALDPGAVERQLTGGLIYGIGRAVTERFAYDEAGHALTTDYTTYLLPRFSDIPPPIVALVETPSPRNPLGVKGVGEAGAIPVGAAIASAVEHALAGATRVISLPVVPFAVVPLPRPADEAAPATAVGRSWHV